MFNWAWQRYINEASAWKSVCDETQNLNKTESKTFPILNFLIPKSTLFSMPNFSDTESNTFLIPKPLLFQYRNRYFFYINFFDTESDTIKKIENRNVTHWKCQCSIETYKSGNGLCPSMISLFPNIESWKI